MDTFEEAASELYGLPRGEFVPARARLAGRLREEGDGPGAARVATLRKPTVAAWAVNQIARTHPRELGELIEVGHTVGRLQRKGPRAADDLREATRRRRRSIDALVQAAQTLLVQAGTGATRSTLDAVERTLEAAARDEEARARVLRGDLDRELEPPVGFGDLSALQVVPAAPSGPDARHPQPTPPPPPRDRQRAARARRRAGELTRAAEQEEETAALRRREASDRHREALKARDRARRAERAAASAEKEADLARRAAEKAERKATTARERAERAAAEAATG